MHSKTVVTSLYSYSSIFPESKKSSTLVFGWIRSWHVDGRHKHKAEGGFNEEW